MTTRISVHDLCRRRLGDLESAPEFSNLQINQWINDAIADYSVFFPRELSGDLTLTTGTHSYSMSTLTGLKRVLKVEYPKGEDPPEYLVKSVEKDSPSSFYGSYCYDLLDEPPSTIILGPDVTTGQKATITYQADHDYPAADSTVLTVPDRHLELLVLFVRMAAAQEISAKQNMDPQVTTLLSSTLSTHANRCEREYRTKLGQFLAADSPGGQMTSWDMDDHGQVY